MIKTGFNAQTADIDELFHRNGFTLAPFGIAERDAYTGQLTLSDSEEQEGKSTELYIDCGFDGRLGYCVTVYDEGGRQIAFEAEDTLAEALADYERLTAEHETNATRVIM